MARDIFGRACGENLAIEPIIRGLSRSIEVSRLDAAPHFSRSVSTRQVLVRASARRFGVAREREIVDR